MRPLLLATLFLSLATPALAAETPYTLERAIARVLATHPDALIAEVRTKSAGLAVADANAQRVQLGVSGTLYQRHGQTGISTSTSPSVDQTLANGSVALTVPLFTGFKLTNTVQAAEKNHDASLASQDAARRSLSYQVTQAFWSLRRSELIEVVQAKALEQTNRTLELTQAGFKLGRQAANEVERAQVSVLNAKGELLRFQDQTRQACIQLASFLEVPAEELQIDAGNEQALGDLPQVAIERVLASRPEVRAAELSAAAAQSSHAAAQGDRWPQLAATTTYQHGNDSTFVPSNPAYAGTWDARLTASFNVFDLGRVERAIERSSLELQQANANLDKTRRELRTQILQALIGAKGAQERMMLAERSTQAAERTLQWVQTRYQQGYSSMFDVNEALGLLMTARMQRIQAFIDERLARAELARALGTPL